jgi:hypothetical protein
MQGILRCHCDTLWWNIEKVIISHSKEVSTDGRSVVGLRRVGHRAILMKANALRSEGIEDRLNGGGHIQEKGTWIRYDGFSRWNLLMRSPCFQAKPGVAG